MDDGGRTETTTRASAAAVAEAAAGGPRFASSRVPLYYQLATLLRQKITGGDYAPGDQVPPESELVRSYGVSRMTVRQALAELADAGLVRREPGRGTFVTEAADADASDVGLDHSISDLIQMGEATAVDLLDLSEVPAGTGMARDLEVERGTPIIRCKRLRRVKGKPYCYIENFVPPAIGNRIAAENWRRGSVLRYIESDLGIPLQLAKQRIRASLADAAMAGHLEVRIGAPVLLVDYLIRSVGGSPVERARLYYRSDYTFTLHLTRSEGDPESPWSLERHRLEA